MFKICVIGCGGIADGFHLPAIKKYCDVNPGAVMQACCDIDMEKARTAAEKFGCGAYYDDYVKMLCAENPDAVCLLVSYNVISQIAVDIISKGFPLLIEKPPGSTADEVKAIINAAEKSGVHNQIAFNRRFTPMVSELKSFLNKYPSPIHNIRCVFHRVNRKDNDFYTTAIHGIDTVRYIAGSDYKQINFRYQELADVNDGAANIYLDCVMESGAAAQLSFCPCAGKVTEDYFVTCKGSEYSLKMPVWGSLEYPGKVQQYINNEYSEEIYDGGDRFGTEMFEKFGFYWENADFFDNVRYKKPSANDIKSALQSVEVAHCIHKREKSYNKNGGC